MTEAGLALEQYVELESSFPTWITVYPYGFRISLCWWIAGVKQECKQVSKNRASMVKTWHLLVLEGWEVILQKRLWTGKRLEGEKVKGEKYKAKIFSWLWLIGYQTPAQGKQGRDQQAH